MHTATWPRYMYTQTNTQNRDLSPAASGYKIGKGNVLYRERANQPMREVAADYVRLNKPAILAHLTGAKGDTRIDGKACPLHMRTPFPIYKRIIMQANPTFLYKAALERSTPQPCSPPAHNPNLVVDPPMNRALSIQLSLAAS